VPAFGLAGLFLPTLAQTFLVVILDDLTCFVVFDSSAETHISGQRRFVVNPRTSGHTTIRFLEIPRFSVINLFFPPLFIIFRFDVELHYTALYPTCHKSSIYDIVLIVEELAVLF